MSDAPKDLLAAAAASMANAYAPYSDFKVGAAVRSADGKVFAGCNVENAAYAVVQCAEGNAVGTMVAAGDCKITEILVLTAADKVASPCGACRQIINEFAAADAKVYLCSTDGTSKCIFFRDLLPDAFGPEQLK